MSQMQQANSRYGTKVNDKKAAANQFAKKTRELQALEAEFQRRVAEKQQQIMMANDQIASMKKTSNYTGRGLRNSFAGSLLPKMVQSPQK